MKSQKFRVDSLQSLTGKTAFGPVKRQFARLLQKWNGQQNRRQMPWKGERDPYKIWLSEIILQQTRVSQGLQYYNRFLSAFPDLASLAAAREDDVYKLWEGLGYYTRCRNLITTARYITGELKGEFPDTYDQLKLLKGVGPYTAAAIASFAFGLPHAVVDGNVYRILARVFGINKSPETAEGKKLFTNLANELLDRNDPASYNQAIMDFGSLICKPATPDCPACVFRKNCYAYINSEVQSLPLKGKKNELAKRWFYYLVIEWGDQVLLRKRTDQDIWNGLYEFILVEKKREVPVTAIMNLARVQGILYNSDFEQAENSMFLKQQLSHQLIMGKFIKIRVSRKIKLPDHSCWVKKRNLSRYPFPRMICRYLDQQSDPVLLK